MTNYYDVLNRLQVKATATVEKAVKEELEKEDPPKEEAKAILEEKLNESTKGNDRKRSSRSDKQDL
tara:strand:- start:2482 stop:2679 length:198 start_codon:yes stop_codon:yes gene_type:complete